MPQLRFARGYNGTFRCHVKAAPVFKALFEKWEQDDLLHLIVSFEGCFVPRYKRNQAPAGRSGHAEKKSSDVKALSNHSFGSAFDINFVDNMLGTEPAISGQRGAVRERRGGQFFRHLLGRPFHQPQDGMHFEISKLPSRR